MSLGERFMLDGHVLGSGWRNGSIWNGLDDGFGLRMPFDSWPAKSYLGELLSVEDRIDSDCFRAPTPDSTS